jgi:hypothetical protein
LEAARVVLVSSLLSVLGIKMGYLGFFYVESKSFELSSEAGKRFKLTEWGRGKLKSLELGSSRLMWLLKSLEEVVPDSVEMGSCRNHRLEGSVMFIQKRKNGNGRFMEISEYGRGGKRSQVVIPEGWDSSGWNKCIHQLRLLAKHVKEQGSSSHKKRPLVYDQFVVEGRSFAEVAEGKKKGSIHESMPAMDVVEKGSDTIRPVLLLSKNGLARMEASFSEQRLVEKAGSIDKEGDNLGELPESNSQTQVELCVGKGAMMTGYGHKTGLEGKAVHGELCAFNATQELWACRETLRKLKGEVESGLARLDWAFKNIEGLGPGQGCISRIQISPKDKEKWVKPKKGIKAKWVGSGHPSKAGAGNGPKPSDIKRPVEAGPDAAIMKVPGLGRWKTLSFTETASSVGVGKSASSSYAVPESSDERGFDFAAPVSSKERLGSSSGGQGVPKEGVSSPILVAATSVGLGKTTSTSFDVPESPDEMGLNLAAPVGPKERHGSSSGDRGATEDGASPPVLVAGDSGRPVCLGYECLASVSAPQKEKEDGLKSSGESGPLEFDTGASGSKPAPNQQRVYVRKECSPHKITKSWVAKRCALSDDRGDSSSLGKLGKSPVVSATNLVLGDSEGIGIPGEMVDQEGMPEDTEWKNQGASLSSPAVKEMKRVWEVREIAGLSCGGQEGKLKDTLGQILANKYGNEASSSAEGEAENIMRLRDDSTFYEA